MSFLGQEEQVREFQDRFKYLYAALFIALGLLLMRLVFLQILNGEKLRQYSEENRIKRVKVAAPRGMIFDTNRTLLIDNRPAFDLEIIPQYLRESRQSKQVLSLLARLVHMKEAEIEEALQRARFQPSFMPVKIKTDLSRDEVAAIESWRIEMPGVEVREEIKRTNIFGDIAAHLLGYIGEVNAVELPKLNQESQRYKLGDSIGKFGIEQRLETTLRGVDGEEIKEVDALGRSKLGRGRNRVLGSVQTKASIAGKNLILTIDQDLQLAANTAFGDRIGAMVAINPRNGQILAMLSRPSFDPTEFSRGIPSNLWNRLLSNPNRPLRDKTIQDHYPPGSTFKIVTAIAALEEGLINENTRFHCSGSIRFGNRLYHCHSKHGHGEVNVVSAITRSCDIFFYRVAQKFRSVDDIAKWARHLGFGNRTGIMLPREITGLIPTEDWKQRRFNQPWNGGETLSVAIGQSYTLATVIQLANSYAAIGNGGTLFRPQFVKQVESIDGQILSEFAPEVLDDFRLKPSTVAVVKQGLWGVVNTPAGTAFARRLPGMDFAGKTGTAQVIRLSADKIYQKCENMRFQDRHHGLFVGFAPVHDPVIAVAVVAEHACHGASGAAPVAQQVIKTYLQKYFPDQYGQATLLARAKKADLYPTQTAAASSSETEDEDVSVADDTHLPHSNQNRAPPVERPALPAVPPGDIPDEAEDSSGPSGSSE